MSRICDLSLSKGASTSSARIDSATSSRSRLDSHHLELPGSMRELSPATGVGRVIKSGTTMTSRKREVTSVGSVIKKRRKRMAKKKHRKLLKRTRIQRRRAGK